MSESKDRSQDESNEALWKRKGFYMAMGFAGLLLVFATVAIQEVLK